MKVKKYSILIFLLYFLCLSFPCDVDGYISNTWLVRNARTDGRLRDIIYAKNLFVAVGDPIVLDPLYGYYFSVGEPTILVSPDGSNWTVKATDASLTSVAFGSNTFVAVGSPGMVLTSSDANTWTQRTPSYGGNLNGIAFGNNLFVAVGTNGTIITSINGIVWTTESSGITSTLIGVAYANNLFIAVGHNGSILSSSNGKSWSLQYSGIDSFLSSVSYCNGVYIAVGDQGKILTSQDGILWSLQASETTKRLFGVTYGDNNYVAVGDDGIILKSSDGITWNTMNSPVNNNLDQVIYANGTFIAVGDPGVIIQTPVQQVIEIIKNGDGSGAVFSSPEGINCGNSCFEKYDHDTYLILTAQPDTRSVFSHWSGDCSGLAASCLILLNTNKTVTAFFTAIIEPGDVNGNGILELSDAILGLQVNSSMIPSTNIFKRADVNTDGKIGMAEVIYILQKVAGMR
jgi:hypothetical protein